MASRFVMATQPTYAMRLLPVLSLCHRPARATFTNIVSPVVPGMEGDTVDLQSRAASSSKLSLRPHVFDSIPPHRTMKSYGTELKPSASLSESL